GPAGTGGRVWPSRPGVGPGSRGPPAKGRAASNTPTPAGRRAAAVPLTNTCRRERSSTALSFVRIRTILRLAGGMSRPARPGRGPGYTESPDGGRRPAAPSLPRSHGLGSGPYPGAARPRSEPLRARRLLPPLVRALRLQAFGAAPEAAALRR